jgi:hypothetical protein
MILQDFRLTNCNHFIAFQKHSFLNKSIYLVITANDIVIGMEVNKRISTENSSRIGSLFSNIPLALKRGYADNPYSYIKKETIKDLEKRNIFSKDMLLSSKNNFKIDKVHINQLVFAGLANTNFPNSGNIIIETKVETVNHPNPNLRIPSRQLTLIGTQDYEKILAYFNTKQLQ